MGRFIVWGGRPLFGEVTAEGSKNGALPVLFATLLCKSESVIENFPTIGDTEGALLILRALGARDSIDGKTLYIDTSDCRPCELSAELTAPLRASTYLCGACLGAFGRASVPAFGGCGFARRPIDLHLDAVRAFGGRVEGERLLGEDMHPARHEVGRRSVGATVNSLLIAASLEGESVLYGCAREPHIDILIDFLRSAGARISTDGDRITVFGGRLRGGRVKIGGDMIEAGSYLAAAAVTGGCVTVRGFATEELTSFLEPLGAAGCSVEYLSDGCRLCGRTRLPFRAVAAPYPAFPTDLQPIAAAIMAAGGGGEITDGIFPTRFGYLDGLSRLGVLSTVGEGRARITPSKPRCGTVTACDLRGGMSALLLSLAARGSSVINSAETVLRGYGALTEKLTRLGAIIAYEN